MGNLFWMSGNRFWRLEIWFVVQFTQMLNSSYRLVLWPFRTPPRGVRELPFPTSTFPAPAGKISRGRTRARTCSVTLLAVLVIYCLRDIPCACTLTHCGYRRRWMKWEGDNSSPFPSLSPYLSFLALPPCPRAVQHPAFQMTAEASAWTAPTGVLYSRSLCLALCDTHLEITTWLGTWAWRKVRDIETRDPFVEELS